MGRQLPQTFSTLLLRLKEFGRVAWPLANSPLPVAVAAGLILAWVARSYAERDAVQRDFESRRDKLANSLAELQQRLSYLKAADGLWKERCDYPKASAKEWEAITATGDYIPTLPSYRGVHLSVVINEVEKDSGVPDPRAGAAAFMGSFAVPPPGTAVFVRDQIAWLQRYNYSRSFLISIGSLPLVKGQELDDLAVRMLDIPGITPGADTRLHQEVDRHASELMAELETPGRDLPSCTEPPTFKR